MRDGYLWTDKSVVYYKTLPDIPHLHNIVIPFCRIKPGMTEKGRAGQTVCRILRPKSLFYCPYSIDLCIIYVRVGRNACPVREGEYILILKLDLKGAGVKGTVCISSFVGREPDGLFMAPTFTRSGSNFSSPRQGGFKLNSGVDFLYAGLRRRLKNMAAGLVVYNTVSEESGTCPTGGLN